MNASTQVLKYPSKMPTSATWVIAALAASLGLPSRTIGEDGCDTCNHPTTENISAVEYNEYSPGKPTIGPPKATTVHGKACDPMVYITVTTTKWQLIDGQWKQDPLLILVS